jgi:hypothetical protein
MLMSKPRMVTAWRPTVFHLLLLVFFTFVGCRTRTADTSDASPPPFLGRTTADSARAKEELWRRAEDGDAVDLARLADREGALGLLEGLEEGGPVGIAALKALPFADDAEAAYAKLGEILRQINPAESLPFLTAIAGIARRPVRQAEPVDPPGLRSCASALLAVAKRADLPKNMRVEAISTLRLLAERHGVDPAAIPTDLDVN